MKNTYFQNHSSNHGVHRHVHRHEFESKSTSAESVPSQQNEVNMNARNQSGDTSQSGKNRLQRFFDGLSKLEQEGPDEKQAHLEYNRLPKDQKALVDRWMVKLPKSSYVLAMKELENYHTLLRKYDGIQKKRILSRIDQGYLPSDIAAKHLMNAIPAFKEGVKSRRWKKRRNEISRKN